MTQPKHMGRGTQRHEPTCTHGRYDKMCEDRDCPHFGCDHGKGIDCGACKALKRSLHSHRLRTERVVALLVAPLLALACSGEAFVSEADTSAEEYPDAEAGVSDDAWQAPETPAKPAEAGVPDSNGSSAETSDDASSGNCCDGFCVSEPQQACACNSGKECCYQWECPTP